MPTTATAIKLENMVWKSSPDPGCANPLAVVMRNEFSGYQEAFSARRLSGSITWGRGRGDKEEVRCGAGQ